MRKMMMKIASLALAVSLLTGCRISNTAKGTPEISGGAVSESVAVFPRQAGSKDANDNNKYAVARWRDALFQGSLDAEPDQYDQTVYMDISSVEWVTNDWIYYTAYGDTEEEWLWRMPIEKTKKGNKPRKEKKEKIFKKYEVSVIYATDTYLIVKICDDEEFHYCLCKYDLGTKKLTELTGYRELGDFWFPATDESDNPMVVNGDLLIEGEENGEERLFRVNLETGKVL